MTQPADVLPFLRCVRLLRGQDAALSIEERMKRLQARSRSAHWPPPAAAPKAS